MSLIKKELTDKNLYSLTVNVDRDTFEAAIQRAYKKNVGKINIPGFRKGKAPRAIIEKFYGREVFYDDAINDCIPDAYEAAVTESGLSVVGRPELVEQNVDENGLTCVIRVYVKPEVAIADYKGIEAVRDEKAVTDADVDAEIERVRERNARTVDVTDRAAAMGDTVKIDFDGSVDGVAFDGGKAEGHELKLGSGQFIPGFEDQIVGHAIGDAFDVNVTFPEDYHEATLAGKAAVFAVKLHAIQMTELPALDDEFAKDVSEFDTLAEYRADLLAKMTERSKSAADSQFEEAVMAALIEKLEADIPACMIDVEAENLLRDYDNRLRMQGLDLATYFKYTGMTLDTMREQFRPQAEKQVKLRLALEKIAELEGITVSAEDIDAEYKRIAEAYNMPEDEVRKLVDEAGLTEDLRVKAAAELVKGAAVAVAAAPAAKKVTKKPAAKKTTAKKPATEGETAEETPAEAPAAPKKTTTRKKAAPAAEGAETEAKPAAKKTTTRKPAAKKTATKPTDEDKAEN